MAISTLVFWLIVLFTGGSALVVVSARNILHAGFALATAFLGVGALYVFLHADFVAAVQLIVYVGGILVLIMFAIMFSSNVAEDTSAERRGSFAMGTGGLAAVLVFIGIFLMVRRLEKPLAEHNQYAAVDYSNTVGVQFDNLSSEEKTRLENSNKILNPGDGEKPADELSNAELKERIDKAGLKSDDAEALLNLYKRQRSHYGIGHKLIGEYILPFEVVSILLLAALVGAVVIVRKELN
ncbi:MAG TPA: NADH-quinone oxidoreductase subunit J [Planctomycetota bacterium]|nr:NADH-quinone oxidoreductase subunit J [Planctomycetota bacterium]